MQSVKHSYRIVITIISFRMHWIIFLYITLHIINGYVKEWALLFSPFSKYAIKMFYNRVISGMGKACSKEQSDGVKYL